VVRPSDSLLELQEQFVRLRVTNMADVDVGRFDFDFDTTFAVLALNADGQVYTRYGARDSKSAESFVSLPSLETALRRSLDLHDLWRDGRLQLPEAGASRSSRSYEFVENIGNRRCIHCHDVASGKAIEQFDSPTFDLRRDIWIYPEPASLGLDLDPDDGATLHASAGVAAAAGLKAGDRIVAIENRPTSTYGDIQHALHRLPEESQTVRLTLGDGRHVELPLPSGWRYSDISWRRLGLRLSPSAGFGGSPLSAERKVALGLPADGFATQVSFFDFPRPPESPLLQDDVVFAVNGVQSSRVIDHAALYISLSFSVGDTLELGVIRAGERLTVPLTVSQPPSQEERIMDSDSNGRGGRMLSGGAGKGKGKGKRRSASDP
jgi:hypothetical protein